MTRADRRWVVTAAAAWALVAAVHGLGARPQAPGAAYLVRSLETPSDRHEERSALLDRPVLPGSLMKVVTLVAALDHGVISPDTTHACRRVVTVDGVRLACSHPDLHRPLDAAEALAYSCNDYFVSLAGRLSRRAFNETRVAAGLPPIDGSTPLGPALVGLAGPRVPPRVMLDVIARVAGFDKDRPMTVSAAARATLVEGMTGAATYGTAAVLDGAGLSALAKTGTSPMPGGGFLGLVVALTPAAAPTRAIVVVAPGAGGTDAASIAADIIGGDERGGSPRSTRSPAEAKERAMAPTVPVPAMTDTVRVGVTGPNGKVRVQRMRLDEYVAEVVTGEGEPRAGDAAQRALAITVRTFALANLGRHRAEGFDLCDTTHCQVLRSPTAAARRAAGETTGRILAAGGRPASVFYSASCGGHVELASAVWPGADDYATPAGLDDEACETDPEWTSDMRASDIERALRGAGLRGDRLRNLRIESRTASGRAAVLRAEGFSPATVRAHDFRMAVGRVLGWQRLKSLAFDIRRTGNGYRFRGRGFGHGVGLCVIGAGRRAAAGQSTEAILHFYFPGLALATVGGQTTTAASRTAPVAPAKTAGAAAKAGSGASARHGIELRLPAAEERDRAVIIGAIADARRDVAARSGMPPPPVVRVTVHPTVESFTRATRQPWWVSAATSGNAIDMLPASVLRRRGILERTLRHELAHVIVDPTLEGKPLWVREGAALYLAEPNPPDGGPRSRPRCPSDEEILHPPSAGAQREAYARAESCFRAELARGKKWFEVGGG